MPLRQLTDSEYAALAQKAGLDVPHQELRRVHRLLTADGYQLHQLMPHEQEMAAAFKGMALTCIKHIDEGDHCDVHLEAIEVEEARASTGPNTPRKRCADAVREKHGGRVGHLAARFHHQLHHGFREDWFRTRERLVATRSPEESAAVEAHAKAIYEQDQVEKLANIDARVAQWESEMATVESPNREQIEAQRKRFADARAKLSRPWEAVGYWQEQYTPRFAAEEAWFKGEL